MAAVVPRTLSARELNRALLARQLLLERAELPVDSALDRVGGLQTQYAPSGYIGLWSRLAGFDREDLTRALEERRAIQATLLRSTIQLVSAADYPLLTAAVRRGRQEWYQRVAREQLDGVDLAAATARLNELLADGPRREKDLAETLAADGFPRQAWVAARLWLDLVRVPPSGTWERRRADLYGRADLWLGREAMDAAGEEDGLVLGLGRYLGGFGPAPLADAASWLGLPAAALAPAVDRLELRRFRDEAGRELLDLPDAPLPDARTPAPVRFLPTWDATLLVHARRTGILPEAYRPLVFNTKTPHSVPTFVVDGAVAGTWRYEKGRVELRPFAELPAEAMAELHAEAERLAAFHEGSPGT